MCDGAAFVLEGLPEALAGHLPGGDDAGDHRQREGRFHTLNRETGNRVVSQYVDAETGKPVDEDDEVKGYQRGEDDYVMLEDDELDAVALESTRTIDIDMFVPADRSSGSGTTSRIT